MSETRQLLAELLVTSPDMLLHAVESLCEIDARSDFQDILIPKLAVGASQSIQSSRELNKAITAITELRTLLKAARQSSTPHFFQGGITNDCNAA